MKLDAVELPDGSKVYGVDTKEDRDWLEDKGVDVDDLEAQENIEIEKEKRKQNTDYNGTMVSLTSKDALGLMQVKTAFELGVTETNFIFQNGTVMHLTPETFTPLASWFAVERNKLFM